MGDFSRRAEWRIDVRNCSPKFAALAEKYDQERTLVMEAIWLSYCPYPTLHDGPGKMYSFFMLCFNSLRMELSANTFPDGTPVPRDLVFGDYTLGTDEARCANSWHIANPLHARNLRYFGFVHVPFLFLRAHWSCRSCTEQRASQIQLSTPCPPLPLLGLFQTSLVLFRNSWRDPDQVL